MRQFPSPVLNFLIKHQATFDPSAKMGGGGGVIGGGWGSLAFRSERFNFSITSYAYGDQRKHPLVSVVK